MNGNIFLLTGCFLSILVTSIEGQRQADGNTSLGNNEGNVQRLLSRRKRFLVFPDGSSFQLVFCTQTHGYLQVGDIVWFGQTAALAWELPTDPQLFYMLKEYKKDFAAQRRKDIKKTIYYLNEHGKVIGKMPFKRKPIVNPAFAKRSTTSKKEEASLKRSNIKKLHEMQNNSSYLQNLDEQSISFHRNGRKSLYAKLEHFLEALGWRGKECVLRYLCETGKRGKLQGSFLEEIFKATFTLPKSGQSNGLEDLEDYDSAHQNIEECDIKYPRCTMYNE